jgi:hypothetical protein
MNKYELLAQAKSILTGEPADTQAAKLEFWSKKYCRMRLAARPELLGKQTAAGGETFQEAEHQGVRSVRSIAVGQLVHETCDLFADIIALSLIDSPADDIAKVMTQLTEIGELVGVRGVWCHRDSSSVKNGSVAGSKS